MSAESKGKEKLPRPGKHKKQPVPAENGPVELTFSTSEAAPLPSNGHHRPAITPPTGANALDALRVIESKLKQPEATGRSRAALVEELSTWMEGSVAASGLLRSSPERTPEATALLLELRPTLQKKGWSSSLDQRLETMLRALAQVAHQGAFVGSPEEGGIKRWKKLLSEVKSPSGLQGTARWLGDLLEKGKVARGVREKRELGIHCDESRWSVLRSDWTTNAPHAVIQAAGPRMTMSLRLGGELVMAGEWETVVEIDGKAIDLSGDWENVGWNSDDWGQYVEYRKDIGSGRTLERVVYLARPTGILVAIDAVRTEDAGGVRLENRWKTVAWENVRQDGELRVIDAESANRWALRVLPIGSAARWSEPSPGSVRYEEEGLGWWLEQAGPRLAVPMVFSWDKKRLAPPRTWRSLTVTNDGPSMKPSEAVAFRLVHEGKNIVVYRSLLGTRRMAFLGHQTFYETLVGEMRPDGTLRDWLSVDADPDTPWDYFAALTHRQHTSFHPGIGHERSR